MAKLKIRAGVFAFYDDGAGNTGSVTWVLKSSEEEVTDFESAKNWYLKVISFRKPTEAITLRGASEYEVESGVSPVLANLKISIDADGNIVFNTPMLTLGGFGMECQVYEADGDVHYREHILRVLKPSDSQAGSCFTQVTDQQDLIEHSWGASGVYSQNVNFGDAGDIVTVVFAKTGACSGITKIFDFALVLGEKVLLTRGLGGNQGLQIPLKVALMGLGVTWEVIAPAIQELMGLAQGKGFTTLAVPMVVVEVVAK